MEKPILFNTEMVRAILDGRKTMTRRIIKEQPLNLPWQGWITSSTDKKREGCASWANDLYTHYVKPPYSIGDILWVRETFADTWTPDSEELGVIYKADGEPDRFPYWGNASNYKCRDEVWRPSIHMPRSAARLFLRVKDVRVERLQEITEEGAKAEGIRELNLVASNGTTKLYAVTLEQPEQSYTAKQEFTYLWNSTIKKQDLDKYGWDANPWVWVIEFERIEGEANA